jgi:cytochrome c5
MRMRWLVIAAAFLAASLPGVAAAVDAPHDASFSDGNCNNCHTEQGKGAPGRVRAP